MIALRKLIICFENMICSFIDMTYSKNIIYLLRMKIYDIVGYQHDMHVDCHLVARAPVRVDGLQHEYLGGAIQFSLKLKYM